jgi:death on curing protein
MPTFLTLDEVLKIHGDQVGRYGGSSGVRDLGLLESALAMPQATFGGQFLHAGLFEMAAAYLFHVAKNHPFIDGNKRTGAVAALVFLVLNGVEIDAEQDDLERIVRACAEGKADKASLTTFFRTHVRQVG